jgi:hypothetical protein
VVGSPNGVYSKGDVPRSPATTSFAHCTYSSRRSVLASSPGRTVRDRPNVADLIGQLYNLAPRLLCGRLCNLHRFRSAFGNDLSSVTSNTINRRLTEFTRNQGSISSLPPAPRTPRHSRYSVSIFMFDVRPGMGRNFLA